MIRGALAAARTTEVMDAADRVLQAGGAASDAVAAGYFTACGLAPDVLLGPAIALVVGGGAGRRLFDGRSAQPGLGTGRPRGFVDADTIPAAAWAAAPRGALAVLLMAQRFGRAKLRSLTAAGVDAARAAGAKTRAGLLADIGQGGVTALRRKDLLRAALAVAGPVAGGLLTEADLAQTAPAEEDLQSASWCEDAEVLVSPYASEGARPGSAIVACDARGQLAALAYAVASAAGGGAQPIAIDELELALAPEAVPVRRGVTRVAPGSPLPAPAPVAILVRPDGLQASVGRDGAAVVSRRDLELLATATPLASARADLLEPSAWSIVETAPGGARVLCP